VSLCCWIGNKAKDASCVDWNFFINKMVNSIIYHVEINKLHDSNVNKSNLMLINREPMFYLQSDKSYWIICT